MKKSKIFYEIVNRADNMYYSLLGEDATEGFIFKVAYSTIDYNTKMGFEKIDDIDILHCLKKELHTIASIEED